MRWNAMVLSGGPADAPPVWRDEGGPLGRSYFRHLDALIWSERVTQAEHDALHAAFRPALESCSSLRRASSR